MINRKAVLLFLLINTLFIVNSFEKNQVMEGEIYRKDSSREDLLYTQKEFRKGDYLNGMISHRYYKKDENLAAYETVKLEKGRIKNYETAIYDMGFSGILHYNGDRIELKRVRDGKEKVKTMRTRENLIVGPLLPYFLKENIPALKRGEIIQFYLPYFDMMTLVPMVLEKNNTSPHNTESTVSVDMKMRNRLLRLLIDSIELVVDSGTGNIVEIHGRTILPDPADNSSKQYIDTDIYYRHRGTK